MNLHYAGLCSCKKLVVNMKKEKRDLPRPNNTIVIYSPISLYIALHFVLKYFSYS